MASRAREKLLLRQFFRFPLELMSVAWYTEIGREWFVLAQLSGFIPVCNVQKLTLPDFHNDVTLVYAQSYLNSSQAIPTGIFKSSLFVDVFIRIFIRIQ